MDKLDVSWESLTCSDELVGWISDASSLSARGLSVIMMQRFSEHHPKFTYTGRDGTHFELGPHEKDLNASVNIIMIERRQNLSHRFVNRDVLFDVNFGNKSVNSIFVLSAKVLQQTNGTNQKQIKIS